MEPNKVDPQAQYGQVPTDYSAPYQPAPVYGQPPAYGQPAVYGQPPVYGQPAYGAQPVYGQPPVYTEVIVTDTQPYGGDATCAWVGCAFSWIPIVGWISACVNWSAPAGSSRKRAAVLSLIIATLMFIINLIVVLSVRSN